jgi:hypothetical protein
MFCSGCKHLFWRRFLCFQIWCTINIVEIFFRVHGGSKMISVWFLFLTVIEGYCMCNFALSSPCVCKCRMKWKQTFFASKLGMSRSTKRLWQKLQTFNIYFLEKSNVKKTFMFCLCLNFLLRAYMTYQFLLKEIFYF